MARDSRKLFLLLGLAGTAGLLMLDWWSAQQIRNPDLLLRRIEKGYAELWQELDQKAERASSRLQNPPRDSDDLLDAFETLAAEARRGPRPAKTFYLVDPDGELVAWAGGGLLHQVEPSHLPPTGRTFRASFSAGTLLSIAPMSGHPGWRVVAGQSVSLDELPVALPNSRLTGWRWTLADPGQKLPPDILAVPMDDGPTMVLSEWEGGEVAGPARHGPTWRHWAWFPLALLMLYLAVSSSAVRVWAIRSRVAYTRPWLAGVHGALALLVLLGASLWLQLRFGPLDLGSTLIRPLSTVGIRLGFFALAAVGLLVIGRSETVANTSRPLPLWGAGGALLAAAVLADLLVAATLLIVVAGWLTGVWLRHTGSGRPAKGPLTVMLISLLASAVAWSVAYHESSTQRILTTLLPSTAPPTAEELRSHAESVETYLASLDLLQLAPVAPADLDRQDLAFEVWHHSPLARLGVLSGLVVFPPDGPPSTFGFGLPLTPEGEVEWSAGLWEGFDLPVWRDARVSGEVSLSLGDQPWGTARYWMVLQPGFRLGAGTSEDLAAGLLRGGPAVQSPAELAVRPASYALYDPGGAVLLSPWNEAPALPPELLAGGEGDLETPVGAARVFTARGADGVRALFQPRPSALASLERIATHTVGTGLALVILGGIVLLVALPATGWKAKIGEAWRSYSKRLVIVYSLLLLVPLVLMNLVVLRILGDELVKEQRSAAEKALDTAQTVLGEYALALEPGFSVDAALDNDLLLWLSRVVHHEVNLYWRSSVYASSKPELFTAGLLPKRIPGEIFSRLHLLRHDLASRINRTGEREYLELYGPLVVPGVPVAEVRLFLSIPQLAQQEEVSAQIASLRRRMVLGTTLLLLILVALGTRLARSFTKPLTDIVKGTQHIAAGETSLGLSPSESELATLVEAIDEMAARIAEARGKLVQEKRVVEGMVENITSGVVSLDNEHRVLMRNRVAADLLELGVGDSLANALEGSDRLVAVRDFLASAGKEPIQRTVELQDAEGNDLQWSLVWVPMPGSGAPSALLVVEDVTVVVRAERLQAWAEMARIIAHEIKNPLTPIRLSAEHMREVRGGDPEHFDSVFENCTQNILRHVLELQQIASEFSTFSRIPRIDPVEGNIAETVREVVDAYRTAPPQGVTIDFEASPENVRAEFDGKLLGRAVRNLVENALRATSEGGRVSVEVHETDGAVQIIVTDDGPGVGPELLSRIFDPYFSTHDSGTGLGLPIARRIAEEHGGHISAQNGPEGGLEVTITLARS